MELKSQEMRKLAPELDPLRIGTGWKKEDLSKPQVMIESTYGDSHPGSGHLNILVEEVRKGVEEAGGYGARYFCTDICDGESQGTDVYKRQQLKTVGPKYGKMLGGIKAALDNLEGNAAMDELNATDALKLDINGQEVTLFREDLLIESAQMPGYVSENDNGITVVMDTNLSEELLEEGFVREIISKVQTMRKEAGFEVMDKIAVSYEGTEKAEKVFADNASTIAEDVYKRQE